MNLVFVIAVTFVSLFIFFNIFYVISLYKKDMSVVDTAWGGGFLIIALSILIAKYFTSDFLLDLRGGLVASMVFLWSFRLSSYLHRRNKKKGEDFRYQKWRRDWGENVYIISYFKVFMLQMFLLLIVSLPVSIALIYETTRPLGSIEVFGIALWIVGFSVETIADRQLEIFKAKNPGQIMQQGLWRYSRHPNYFGEAVLWWGICLVGWSGSLSLFLLSGLGPLTLTFFLLKISGVPMLEQKYEDDLDYQRYRETTSSFIPWWSSSK